MRWMFFLLIVLCGCSNPVTHRKKLPKTAQEIVSFDRGYCYWKEQLKYAKLPYDVNQVIAGILSADRGQQRPYSDYEIASLVQKFKQEVYEMLEKENLLKAKAFLLGKKEEKGVVELVPEKLYYKVIREGHGRPLDGNDDPHVTFTVKTLDSSVFSTEKETKIHLMDTITGFAQGVLGMLEGEERVLYIHPDFAYGNFAGKLDPNSLVIIEVKLIKISP